MEAQFNYTDGSRGQFDPTNIMVHLVSFGTAMDFIFDVHVPSDSPDMTCLLYTSDAADE